MQSDLERMVRDYDAGRISRRQLLTGLAAVVAMASGAGRAVAESPFVASGLNHVALAVTDVGRSSAFYQDLLGLEVSRQSAGSAFLTCGDQFLALFRASEAGLHHYCYGVPGYEARQTVPRLRAAGLEPRVEGDRVYFPDPDGLTVQLARPDHRA